jgi:hypothetical protein
MIVDPLAEVFCFSYVLFLADSTADEIDAVISFAEKVSKNFVTVTYNRTTETLSV